MRVLAMSTTKRLSLAALGAAILVAAQPLRATSQAADVPEIQWFIDAAQQDGDLADAALDKIAAVWRDGYTPLIIDMARFMQPTRRFVQPSTDPIAPLGGSRRAGGEPPRQGGFGVTFPLRQDPSSIVRRRLIDFLEEQTGQRFGDDLGAWRQWMWQLPYAPHPAYDLFKGAVYARADPELRHFLPSGVATKIRLDEVDWGGVGVNGIPPLEHPTSIPADEAGYLKNDHIVFGISVNGEARAYPKRILAWHELALDRLGGEELTIVYCTLCGTVIPYDSVVGGRLRTFGTSGLLYRSNKLMFDAETRSLWSAFDGTPVVGPLVGSGLRLSVRSVVTTTWGEWKAQHPDSTVLSIGTGYDRDYSEGAAYRDYFATDELMFEVPSTDERLDNKDEVLIVRDTLSDDSTPRPLAIAVKFLEAHPVYHLTVDGRRVVAITSPRGATRVYEAGAERFTRRLDAARVQDAAGGDWQVTETALVSAEDPTRRLRRLAAHRAFWFGWYAQFPNTDLLK